MKKYSKLMFQYRKEILFLAYQKIKTQYAETSFGIGWAVVKPMVFIASFWFFIRVGLRHGSDMDGFPYLLYLFAGYMPWFLMSSLIVMAPNVILSNKELVKTIKFPVMALPIIQVLSELLVHIAVMFLVFVIYIVMGGWEYAPDVYYLNFIYYWFTMVVFFSGLGFILAPLAVIIKDIKPLVSAIMQPIFWITPVLYTPDTPKFELIMRIIDPLYYFIIGYREALLYEKPFYSEIWYDIYIWIIILLMYFIGLKLWNKVRPFMADLI